MLQKNCPHCSQALNLKPEYLGKTIRCPKCKQTFKYEAEVANGGSLQAEEPIPKVIAVAKVSRVDHEPLRRLPKVKSRFPHALVYGLIGGGVVLGGLFMILLVGFVFWPMLKQTPSNKGIFAEAPDQPVINPIDILPNPVVPNQANPRPKIITNPRPVKDAQSLGNMKANDLVYDPISGLLLVAVADTSEMNPNSVTAIDPSTGKAVWKVNVGSNPKVIAVSDNGKALWIGLGGAPALQRLDLEKRSPSALFTITGGRFGAEYVEDLEVMPGTTDTVVASLMSPGISPRHRGVAVFDKGIPRPDRSQDHTGSNRITASEDPTVFFGFNNESTEFGLRKLMVDVRGIQEVEKQGAVFTGFNTEIWCAGSRIYSSTGKVASTQNLAVIGTFPEQGAYAVNVKKHQAYCLVPGTKLIKCFDSNSFTLQSSVTVQTDSPIRGNKLVLLNDTGLAFCTEREIIIVPLSSFQSKE